MPPVVKLVQRQKRRAALLQRQKKVQRQKGWLETTERRAGERAQQMADDVRDAAARIDRALCGDVAWSATLAAQQGNVGQARRLQAEREENDRQRKENVHKAFREQQKRAALLAQRKHELDETKSRALQEGRARAKRKDAFAHDLAQTVVDNVVTQPAASDVHDPKALSRAAKKALRLQLRHFISTRMEVDRHCVELWLNVPRTWPSFGGAPTEYEGAEHLELTRDTSFGGAENEEERRGALLPFVGAAAASAVGTYYAWLAWRRGGRAGGKAADATALFAAVKAVFDREAGGAARLSFGAFFRALFADKATGALLRKRFAATAAAEALVERGGLPPNLSRWDALKMFEGRYTSPVRQHVAEVDVESLLDLLAGDAAAAMQLVALQSLPAQQAASPAKEAPKGGVRPAAAVQTSSNAPSAPCMDEVALSATHDTITVAVTDTCADDFAYELKVCEGRWHGWSGPWTPFATLSSVDATTHFSGDATHPVKPQTEYLMKIRCKRVDDGAAAVWSQWSDGATLSTERDPAVVAAEAAAAQAAEEAAARKSAQEAAAKLQAVADAKTAAEAKSKADAEALADASKAAAEAAEAQRAKAVR